MDITTTKIPVKALNLLRVIAALTGERQYQVLLRLIEQEYKKIESQRKEGK